MHECVLTINDTENSWQNEQRTDMHIGAQKIENISFPNYNNRQILDPVKKSYYARSHQENQ